MNKRRGGLGKGLQALIPVEAEDAAGGKRLKEIALDQINNDPQQARKTFDQEKLLELAASIREHGVIQPVVVRPLKKGGYQLIAGERRWRACKLLGLKKVPAVIKDYADIEAKAISLIENVQREDLNPLEEATAYQQLIEDYGLTQEEVSARVGKSRPFVANMVRLLGLPEKIRELLAGGRLSTGHARALLTITDEEKQIKAAVKIIKRQLNVRQAEQIVKKLLEEGKDESRREKQKKSQLVKMEQLLEQVLGSKVRITTSGNRGKVEVDFKDGNDLKRIVAVIAAQK
jgi:ParB family chromosome partitioning protein